MDELEALAPQEYPNRELLQKILKLLSESPPDIAPLVLFPNQEQADSFREFLKVWLEPMLAR